MYFWNINELKQQLKNNRLPDNDSLTYLLRISLLGMIPIPKPPYFATGTSSLFPVWRNHKIPRSQRYANRPALDKIFPADILRNKVKRDKKIEVAVEKHAYSQKQIADHLGFHYATISGIMTARQ